MEGNMRKEQIAGEQRARNDNNEMDRAGVQRVKSWRPS